ncbi:MAG TPA: sodium:solute symporter, partial [Gemmatimonadaceae bacterium]|nr:sodium:solute symporter [Gemmatimonadaceae bacterium]
MALILVTLFFKLPVPPDTALMLAGATGKLRAFDFSFDITQTYTFWSGLVGGTFLMLSYFGTDQSQVQRYLTARSVDEARSSLLMSAYWKIPLQAAILLFGVLVFTYYLFRPAPLYFNPADERTVRSVAAAEYERLASQYQGALAARADAARAVAEGSHAAVNRFLAADSAVTMVRRSAMEVASRAAGEVRRDVNYVIPRFVLGELPLGFAGLFIAAVMAAAMSSIAAELNSLSTATIIDFYRRWFRPRASDAHYLKASKVATGVWGFFACVVALYAPSLGSLIEVVNRFGSFFYGSILGVFLLAMIPWAKPGGAFVGLLVGMTAVASVAFGAPQVSFLWHNVIGAAAVVAVGALLSARKG